MQAEAAGLRALNPQLNDREESVKAMIAFRQQRLNDLNAQVQKLGGGLGFVLRAGKIRDLDNERHRLVGQLEELNKQLAEVRQQWKEKHEAVEADQAQVQTDWAGMTVEAGSLKAERDALAADPAGQARRRAVAVRAGQPEGAAGRRRRAEADDRPQHPDRRLPGRPGVRGRPAGRPQGHPRGAGALRRQRLGHRRGAVAAQRVPEGAEAGRCRRRSSAFEKVWEELLPKVRDEKALAAHPAEFVAAMRPFVEQRFTPEIIGGYFEALGKTIKTATAGWRG